MATRNRSKPRLPTIPPPGERFARALQSPRVLKALRAIWAVLDDDDLGFGPGGDRIAAFATLLERESRRLQSLVTNRSVLRDESAADVAELARRWDEVEAHIKKHGVKSAGDLFKSRGERGERSWSLAKFKRVRSVVELRGLVDAFRTRPDIARAWLAVELEAAIRHKDGQIKVLKGKLAAGAKVLAKLEKAHV